MADKSTRWPICIQLWDSNHEHCIGNFIVRNSTDLPKDRPYVILATAVKEINNDGRSTPAPAVESSAQEHFKIAPKDCGCTWCAA